MDERTVITIGREFGSGGHEIGMKLAERLGIKCYDKELLELAAKEKRSLRRFIRFPGWKANQQLFIFSCNGHIFSGIYKFIHGYAINQQSCFFGHSLIPLRNWLKENPVLLSDAVLTMLWKITHLQSAYGLRPIWMSVSSVLKKLYDLSDNKAADMIQKTDSAEPAITITIQVKSGAKQRANGFMSWQRSARYRWFNWLILKYIELKEK